MQKLDKYLSKEELEAKFAVKHRGWQNDPRARRSEKEIVLTPTGQHVNDKPLVLKPAIWEAVKVAAQKAHGIDYFAMPEMTRYQALMFGKALKEAKASQKDPEIIDAIERVAAICAEQRGLRWRWQLKF